MNGYQAAWWRQARSDHETFVRLRRQGASACHLLHYLQMATEKLSKAYLWRSGNPPPWSHAGFVQFLRFLSHVQPARRRHVARLFSFQRFTDFEQWIRSVLPLAYELERLSPDLSRDGPNPEYPWPHAKPVTAPVDHDFVTWRTLMTGRGRDLMRVIGLAVERFPQYADA